MTFDPIGHKTKLLRVTEQWQSLSSALIEIRQRSISPKRKRGPRGTSWQDRHKRLREASTVTNGSTSDTSTNAETGAGR